MQEFLLGSRGIKVCSATIWGRYSPPVRWQFSLAAKHIGFMKVQASCLFAVLSTRLRTNTMVTTPQNVAQLSAPLEQDAARKSVSHQIVIIGGRGGRHYGGGAVVGSGPGVGCRHY